MPDGDERDRIVQRLAREHALTVLPTDPYLGLTREQAEQRARDEGRDLVDRTGAWDTRRADLAFRRVNVDIGAEGTVVRADAG